MKQAYLIVLLCLGVQWGNVHAQSILSGTSGSIMDTAQNILLYYTLGELVTNSVNAPTSFTQGFLQPTIWTEDLERDPFDPDDKDVKLLANVITPGDGNGMNDRFIIPDLEKDFPENTFIVLNRWGEVVYELDNYRNQWEGTDKGGNRLPQATYYFLLFAEDPKEPVLKGPITILRDY